MGHGFNSPEKRAAWAKTVRSLEENGFRRLQHDVVTLPADQVARGLSEAIAEGLNRVDKLIAQTTAELAIVKDNIERLKVLLERGQS